MLDGHAPENPYFLLGDAVTKGINESPFRLSFAQNILSTMDSKESPTLQEKMESRTNTGVALAAMALSFRQLPNDSSAR